MPARPLGGGLANVERLRSQAYVKDSAAKDFREIAKFRGHISLIQQGRYIRRGTL